MDEGYDPLAYLYLCLTAHYRSQLNFSWDALDAAHTALHRLRNAVHALGAAGERDPAYVERFTAEIDDDLNFPRALAVMWEMLKSDLPAAVKKATVLQFDLALGLGLAGWAPQVETIPAHVDTLARARWEARKAKNWSEADRLRGEIHAAGYEVMDEAGGYKLKLR